MTLLSAIKLDENASPELVGLISEAEKKNDLTLRDEEGLTLLHHAVLADHFGLVKLVIEQCPHLLEELDEEDEEDEWQCEKVLPPLHFVKSGEMASLLLANGAWVSDQGASHNYFCTPIFTAVQEGRTDVVKALIDAGADVNAENHGLERPMHYVTDDTKIGILNLLFEAGADLDALDTHDQTPLMNVVMNERPSSKIAQALIDNGAAISLKDENSLTALDHAVLAGSSECVKVLIRSGADPNKLVECGRTLLHVAGSKATEEVLLDAGADPFAKDKEGKMPSGIASEERRRVITQQKHLEAHLSQVPTPVQMSGSAGQGEAIEAPKRRRL